MVKWLFRLVSLTLILLTFGWSPPAAKALPAAVITVNSALDPTDPGKCTLRDAITAANTNVAVAGCAAGAAYPSVDTINISFSRFTCLQTPTVCVITLSSPLPQVVEPVIIQKAPLLTTWTPTISGADLYRVFDLGGVDVTIQNVIITHGNASTTCPGCYGGAITTSSNGGNVTLSNVYFAENHASVRGGALYMPGGVNVVIDNSTFISNTTDAYGGAIDQLGGVLIINNSTITGNSAADGGGIEVQSVSDTRLSNVTISTNFARGNGGGISRIGTGPTMSMNNVTISNNVADSDNNGFGNGGGIYRAGGTVTAANTIIAGNFDTPNNAGSGEIHPDCSWPINDTFTTFGNNLLGRSDGCKGLVNGVNGDIVGTSANPVNPRLGPLAYNGGSTMTHALWPFSPAIDTGNASVPGGGNFGACVATDQRGVARPVGPRCDIGAFEAPVYLRSFLPLVPR